jgi:molybdenum cofactor cytidylyltransferase
MRLIDALRMTPTSRLALTGSGGKSSALFRLGNEFLGGSSSKSAKNTRFELSRVFLTTTTHLSQNQIRYADHHIIYKDIDAQGIKDLGNLKGKILVTGYPVEKNRLGGVPLRWLDSLKIYADEYSIPILIEADGSRQLPLKAPGPKEPVVPDWVDIVAVFAGLSGLNQPLTEEWVFREELFSKLANISLGEIISPQALAKVLGHPFGGLKSIPDKSRRIIVLNQSTNSKRQAAAFHISSLLLPVYESVVVANIPHLASLTYESSNTDQEVIAVHQNVAGVILAAGGSSRFGRTKQVLEWGGKPLVRHVAETALTARLSPVVIVAGNDFESVESAVEGLPVILVRNLNWEMGQASSVRTGVLTLPPTSGAAIFLLADQPMIPATLINSLVELHSLEMAPIVAPLVDGRRANPVLFDRITFPELSLLTGDTGGRVLFDRFRPTWLPWNDSQIFFDIDTPDDYSKFMSLAENGMR